MNKNWVYIIIGIVTLAIAGLLLSFTVQKQQNNICRQVEVHILNSNYNKFLESKDVLSQIENRGIKTKGEPLDKINTYLIETILMHSPVIRDVAVYTTISGKLVIEVEQRIPIVRIIDRSLQQYFIDEEGVVLPDRIEQIAHVLVANGNIPAITVHSGKKVVQNLPDSTKELDVLESVFLIAKFVAGDEFWKAQIEQIFVNEKREIIIIPRIGDHIIIFGDASDIKEKFVKLKSMYYAFNQIGWNQYKVLNLKYKNQIVCVRR